VKRALPAITFSTAILSAGCGQPAARDGYPGDTWQWAESPGERGWSAQKLAVAKAYSERIGSAAVTIVDDGVVIDAWGDVTRNYMCHSMRKSLLSALYGIYVNESKIDLAETLQELGIDDRTPLTQVEKQATVADLLKARSGVYIPAAGESDAMKAARPPHTLTPAQMAGMATCGGLPLTARTCPMPFFQTVPFPPRDTEDISCSSSLSGTL
jgi:CubicO group peptidase (beta-lactamase class C family)